MRRLLVLLLFLVASVWIGLEVVRHPGYLLLVYQPWLVQMPIWFALLALVLVFGLFYLLIISIDRIEFTWFRIKNWLRIRREHQSYSKTQLGLTALIEGRWKKAEKLLLAGVKQSVDPLMNYLSAAKAAHAQQAFDRRDQFLQKAYQIAPKANIAIGLTQAELQMQQNHFEEAIGTLTHLRETSPRHPQVLKMLEKVYVRVGDWQNLQTILPAMRKAKILSPEDFEHFEKNLYCEIFHNAANKRLSDLRVIWSQVPRYLKKNPDVVAAYVTLLARHAPVTGPETAKEMEELIRGALRHHWHPELAKVYGNLKFSNLNRQLVIAGAWMKMYGQQPELLLMLGKFCMQLQLWGRSKDYFSKCLAQGPYAEATLEYGKLLEQLGDTEAALQKYRDGLMLYN